MKTEDMQKDYDIIETQLKAAGITVNTKEVDDELQSMEEKTKQRGLDTSYIINPEYDVDRRRMLRRFRMRAGQVLPEQREGYKESLSYIDAVEEELKEMKRYLTLYSKIQENLEDRMSAASGAKEREQLNALRDQAQELEGKYLEHKEQLIMFRNQSMGIIGAAWGMDVGGYGINDSAEAVENLKNDMEDRGYTLENTMAVAKSIRQSAGRMPLTEVGMILEESNPKLHAAFVRHGDAAQRMPRLTLDEKRFAAQNFDAAFDEVFSREQRQELLNQGKDIFDQIYIDGQSLNERYAHMYGQLPYYDAVEGMKCQFMADILNGKQVSAVLMDQGEMMVLPVNISTGIEELQARLGSAPSQMSLAQNLDLIQKSQDRLASRTSDQIELAREHMWDDSPAYPIMEDYNKGPLEAKLLIFRGSDQGESRKRLIYQLSQESFLEANGDSEEVKNHKKQLMDAGNRVLEDIFMREETIEKNIGHPLYQLMNIKGPEDLVYIDGLPAAEYLGAHGFASKDLNNAQAVRAGIAAALTSGEHHVDIAKLGTDEYGDFMVDVSEVRIDLHELDGQERFYQKTRAHKAEALYKQDSKQRHSEITKAFSEKTAKAINRQNNPYIAAKKQFYNAGVEQASRYFSKEDQNKLDKVNIPELKRGKQGEFGACQYMAKLYLMARHPEVRYADLMNPHKYQAEKLEAGKAVAEAMEDYALLRAHAEWERKPQENSNSKEQEPPKPSFEKLGVLAADVVRAMGQMDVRKELLYALGQPDNIPADQVRGILMDKGNNIMISSFLSSMSNFSQGIYQAVGSLGKGTRALTEINDNSHPAYRAMKEKGLLTDQELRDFNQAVNAATMFDVETNWMDSRSGTKGGTTAEMTAEMAAKMAVWRQLMDSERAWVAEDGKLSHAPQEMGGRFRLIAMNGGKELAAMGITVEGAEAGRLLYNDEIPKGFDQIVTNMQWKVEREMYGQSPQEWFKQESRGAYDEVFRKSGFGILEQEASRLSLTQGAMMAMGNSLDDIMKATPETKRRYNEEFVSFIKERPLNDMKAGEKKDEALKDYAEFYTAWGQQLLKERMPAVNQKNPAEFIKAAQKVLILSQMADDYSQSKSHLKDEVAFKDAMEPGVAGKIDNALEVAAMLGKYAQAMGEEGSEISLSDRAASKYMMEKYGEKMAGKSLEQLGKEFNSKELQEEDRKVRAEFAKEKEDALKNYIDGREPCPVRSAPEKKATNLDKLEAQMGMSSPGRPKSRTRSNSLPDARASRVGPAGKEIPGQKTAQTQSTAPARKPH